MSALLTPDWTKFKPHLEQSRLWYSRSRFKAVVAGRGSGKSAVGQRYMVRQLPIKKPWSDPMYLYGMPTYGQAKRVAWKKLCALIPKSWVRKRHESELMIETVFGSSLYVMGLDKPQRAEGVQWDGVILDESADLKPDVFNISLLPAMSHRNAWCWRIGVPKRFGIGSRAFKSFYDAGLSGTALEGMEDIIESFTWESGSILTPSQLAFAAANLDPVDFAEQYKATWESVGGLLFHGFHPELNVDYTEYDPALPLIVGCDFNVNPMCWVLGHMKDGRLHIVEELVIRNCNTQMACERLIEMHPDHGAGYIFYGDSSGNSRSTTAKTVDTTDWLIIHEHMKAAGKKAKFRVPKSNGSVQKRIACCNAALCNALGQVRIVIDPSCKRLIKDLEDMTYKQGTNQPDKQKDKDLSHMTDAFGYIVVRKFPIRLKNPNGIHYSAAVMPSTPHGLLVT